MHPENCGIDMAEIRTVDEKNSEYKNAIRHFEKTRKKGKIINGKNIC